MLETPVLTGRSAGVLMHVTSLPTPYGIGDIGPSATAWIDSLARAGVSWWQVLPLGPTMRGDSPYSSFAAVGVNTLLVSPDLLIKEDLLDSADPPDVPLPDREVNYAAVRLFKETLLRQAWERFRNGGVAHLRSDFDAFREAHGTWLGDFCLFAALKNRFGGMAWLDWPGPLSRRDPAALREAAQELADEIDFHAFGQFLAHRQWEELRGYARERGVRIIGDLPLFVTADSVDVWARPELFLLGEDRRPTFVAGAPPDYFSPTGQRWGNALYDWERMRQDGYRWWSQRIASALHLADLVRLDHFRGLEAAWHIPAESPTAETGSWEPGPGASLLGRLRETFGHLPLIAEDLGYITPAVRQLRDEFGLPGMAVLQFAFEGDPHNPCLPQNFTPNTVVYTGTHDNDTTTGWFRGLGDAHRQRVLSYTGTDGGDIAWDLIRMAWASEARLAVVPLQDVLLLDSTARMNRPGIPEGNWQWRLTAEHPVAERLAGLRELSERYQRTPDSGTG